MVLRVPAAVRFIAVAEASRFKDALVVAVDYLCEFALVKALLCLERVKYGALCEHHEQVGKKEADKAAGGESKHPRKNHVAGNSPVNAFE